MEISKGVFINFEDLNDEDLVVLRIVRILLLVSSKFLIISRFQTYSKTIGIYFFSHHSDRNT